MPNGRPQRRTAPPTIAAMIEPVAGLLGFPASRREGGELDDDVGEEVEDVVGGSWVRMSTVLLTRRRGRGMGVVTAWKVSAIV